MNSVLKNSVHGHCTISVDVLLSCCYICILVTYFMWTNINDMGFVCEIILYGNGLYIYVLVPQAAVVATFAMHLSESWLHNRPLSPHQWSENLVLYEKKKQESSGWPADCGVLSPILQCWRRRRESTLVCFTHASKQVKYFISQVVYLEVFSVQPSFFSHTHKHQGVFI